jgi:hypothetical protein
MVPALTACSGSSSDGQSKAEASAEASASAVASKLGITIPPTLAPGGHGPNGDITAPASNAPSKLSPGGDEIFPNITGGAELDKVRNHLVKFPGVRAVPYYPQYDQLQVYYDKNATSANRERVYRYVVKHYPAATASPSASPTATSTATATASAS